MADATQAIPQICAKIMSNVTTHLMYKKNGILTRVVVANGAGVRTHHVHHGDATTQKSIRHRVQELLMGQEGCLGIMASLLLG